MHKELLTHSSTTRAKIQCTHETKVEIIKVLWTSVTYHTMQSC